MADKKIVHGNRNFGYATINTTGENPSFGTPVMMPGMVSFEMEVSQDSTSIPADNIIFYKALGVKSRSGTGAFRYIPAEYAELLGFYKNTNGMVTDTGEHKPHCIFFETVVENASTGETTQTLHYLYNAKGQEPKLSTETDEEDITAEEIEIEYDMSDSTFVVDDKGNAVQYAYIERTEENKAIYDTFQTTVLLPKTAIGG